jgi:hypothetical protein
MEMDISQKKSSDKGAEILRRIRNAKSLGQIERYLDGGNLACLVELIRHETLGPLVHERLSKHPKSSIRFEVASQKGTTAALLAKLSLDKNQLVRTTAKERVLEQTVST